MNPQGTNTIVEVTAEAAILQTENANLETNFNKSQVDDLPMPGGDLTTLAMTAPGIRVNVTGGSGNMNANGIPGATILYTLDGMDQNDPANNLNNSGASNNLLGANASRRSGHRDERLQPAVRAHGRRSGQHGRA